MPTEPDPAFSDLSDEAQVASLLQTDNDLSEEDKENIPQPPQDADYRPHVEGGQ